MDGTCLPPRRLQTGEYLKGPIPRERPVGVLFTSEHKNTRPVATALAASCRDPRRFALAWIEANVKRGKRSHAQRDAIRLCTTVKRLAWGAFRQPVISYS